MNHADTYTARILNLGSWVNIPQTWWELFFKSLVIYAREYALDDNYNPGPTPADFDDYLYRLADVVWPRVLALTEKDYPPYEEY